MKVNHLLHEILRGQWLIDPVFLQSHKPLVANIIAGNHDKAEAWIKEEEPKAVFFINQNGMRVDPDMADQDQLVAVVNMIGPVIKYGDMCTWGADEIVSQLNQAERIENVIGTILNVDGPGGSTSAIGPFKTFAQNKTKPVVALCDMMCSLHYWAALEVADHIMADNDVSALIGSVGVYCSFVDEKPYWEKMGIKFHDIYADQSEDKNKIYKLALEGKYDAIKQEHLNPIAIKFQEAVKANRPNLKEEAGVLTGKTFTADKALQYGMIDSIGSMQEAIALVQMMSEINQVTP